MATQDNLRCARCCLVVFDVFSEMMQELLAHRGFPAQKIYDIVMNDVPFVQRLNDTEKKMLQSLRTDQVFSKLDSAIIYKIVKYFKNRQIIPIPSSTRWGIRPSLTDTDIGDDVERIHFARNGFAHKIDAAINETEFEEFFGTFLDVGNRVDSYLQKDPNLNHERRIRDLKTTVLDTETTEKLLEQRMEVEQLKRELVIQENRKEIEIYYGRSVEAVEQRFKDLKEVGDNSLIRLKLIMDNVVDSDEIVNRLRGQATEINKDSTVEIISIEKQCIEFIVNINTYYLTNKDLFLGAVTKFLYILKEKQALIWKGNTVTVVIVTDEDFEEQEIFNDTPLHFSSVEKDTRKFEFEENPSNKGSLVLDLGIKARDLRDGKLNQHLTSFIEHLLRKSNGRELFEEQHVKASLVVEDAWNCAGEADNDVLLNLADQQLNKGNPQDAKVSIGQVEARLDQDFHVIRTSNKTGHIENMMEEYSKRIGIQYKTCSLLLIKIPGSLCDAVRCFYIGLVCYGNTDLYEYEVISQDMWKRIDKEAIQNRKAVYHLMTDLVDIFFNLYQSHTRIILFIASQLTTNLVQLISKLPEQKGFNTLLQRCWFICANCHCILDRDKQDGLNELLNNYSTNGIPHMPELLTLGRETQSEKQDLFEMEPHWSSIVENASGLTKRQHDQQEAIWELLQTEINYIRTLRVITDLFLCVILNLQSEGLLSEIKTEQLSNVGEIVCANCDFWESTLVPVLEEARESRLPLNPSLMRDGFKKFQETFTPYIKYCVEQKSSTDFINARYAENDLFKTYVVWAESQPQCKRLKLTDLLVKPMQRITKYSLLLQAILRKTQEDKQRRALLEMIASVDKFVSSVKLTLKHRHDQERLASIITKIESYDAVEAPNDESLKYIQEYNTNFDLRAPMPGCSASHTRSLIMQSVLKLKDNASRMDVECLLFTDVLLICKPSKRMEKYKIIKPPMRVDRLIVHELKDKGSFLLIYLNEYHIPISAFTFHADQRAINIWIEHIRKAQDIYRNLSRECKNSEPYFVPVTVEEEVIHVTPLQQPDNNPPDVVISRTIANVDNHITNVEPSLSELLSPHALSKLSSNPDIKSRHFTDSVTKDDRKKHGKVQTSYSMPAYVDNSPDDERIKIPSSNVSSAKSDSSLPDIVDDNLKAKTNQRRSSRSEKRYHTEYAIQDLNRIDDKDNSIYRRLSSNFGTTDQNEKTHGVLKRKIQSSDSVRSIHSSSGANLTVSLHLSPEGDICEESDYNTSGTGTIYESRHSEDDYHHISEHDRTKSKSTTDIDILFKELTTSERKDGISSVDLPTMDKNKYSSTHLLNMKRQLLLSADVEASEV